MEAHDVESDYDPSMEAQFPAELVEEKEEVA